MDPLSEVLGSVRLSGGVFLSGRFTAPWCVAIWISPDDCRGFLGSKPQQIIGYHVVTQGRMLVAVDGEPMVDVAAGEIALFPQNDRHTLADRAGLKPIPARLLAQRPLDDDFFRIVHGGGGAETHIMCGFLASAASYNPLFHTLPRVLKVDIRDAASREWIEASVRFAAHELTKGRLASSSVMSRLSESLLTEAVRQYASTLPQEESGWLRGLKDPQIGRALALIHHKLDSPWSAETLAKEVALSRSAFVERFSSLVGMPPIRYLTFWRMQTARQNLRETHKTIAQLAYSVGYGSEEAFSRAFKREFGVAPATWREMQASQ
jgi:AraC-like DNA-binding protein